MNPTLSERVQARSHDPYWRSHPPAPWGRPLETPVALQVLSPPATEPVGPVGPVGQRRREWVLLLAIALVWLWEGLEALLQILRGWGLAIRASRQQGLGPVHASGPDGSPGRSTSWEGSRQQAAAALVSR